MERENIFIVLGQALFAVFGACVKWLNVKDKRRQKLVSLLSEAATAAFVGILVYLIIYSWLGSNVYLAFALAGIIGNQGAKGVDFLWNIVLANSNITGMKDKDDKGSDGK